MSKGERIFLSPPHMGDAERRYVDEAFAANFIAPVGPQLEAFERSFRDRTGFAAAVAVSSGTAAMHLALKGVGVKAGDVVLASTLTFIGSVGPILYEGATPVFIDADAQTWNMDPVLLEEELEQRSIEGSLPKAVVPTDLYGQSCDVDAIQAICDRYGVALVIDAAESLGATCRGRATGKCGDAAVFSFNGNKIITTSGGGMLASDNVELIDRARHLSTQAREPFVHFEHREVGYNYRMSNLLAAVGLGQLEVLDQRVARKREIFDVYSQLFSETPGLSMMPEADYGMANRWLSVILIDEDRFGANAETVRLVLEENNIESRPMWKPMHLQPAFEGCMVRGGEVSEKLFKTGLCLPSGTALKDSQIERITDLVKSCRPT